MGKTAENERFKLKATFNNNLSVGLLLGGFLLPYYSLFPTIFEPSGIDRKTLGSLVGLTAAWAAGAYFRLQSDKAASQIQD